MATDDVLDWLGDDGPELTPEEVQAAWRKFAETELRGRNIELFCSGGDQLMIAATVEEVILIPGVGATLKVNGVTVTSQMDNQSQSLPEACYILLHEFDCPPKFREHSILLPIGGICTDSTRGFSFGGDCLDAGVIDL